MGSKPAGRSARSACAVLGHRLALQPSADRRQLGRRDRHGRGGVGRGPPRAPRRTSPLPRRGTAATAAVYECGLRPLRVGRSRATARVAVRSRRCHRRVLRRGRSVRSRWRSAPPSAPALAAATLPRAKPTRPRHVRDRRLGPDRRPGRAHAHGAEAPRGRGGLAPVRRRASRSSRTSVPRTASRRASSSSSARTGRSCPRSSPRCSASSTSASGSCLVTLWVPTRGWMRANNDLIRTGPKRDRHAVLADWTALARSHPGWFYADRVHLPINGPGATALARLIATRLR